MKKTDAAPVEMEQPRTGGSFVRQEDGTLKMMEGAIVAAELVAEAGDLGDGALVTDVTGEPGDATTGKSEG